MIVITFKEDWGTAEKRQRKIFTFSTEWIEFSNEKLNNTLDISPYLSLLTWQN